MSTIRDHGTARWPCRRRWIRNVVAPLTTSLGAVVRVVHLRHVLLILALLILTYVRVIHPWLLERGSTPPERQLVLPGDGLRPGEPVQYTQAVTIEAPPGAIWPWLMQVGQDKGGFYTCTWLENLIGLDIHNADSVHPEWQELSVGDSSRLAPRDYLWGIGEGAVTPVRMMEPDRALVLDVWGRMSSSPLTPTAGVLLILLVADNAFLTLGFGMALLILTAFVVIFVIHVIASGRAPALAPASDCADGRMCGLAPGSRSGAVGRSAWPPGDAPRQREAQMGDTAAPG